MTSTHASELEEAHGHLNYFRTQKAALEFAMRRMTEDLRICTKEIKRWEARIEKLGGTK
jgi:hypothetical protein